MNYRNYVKFISSQTITDDIFFKYIYTYIFIAYSETFNYCTVGTILSIWESRDKMIFKFPLLIYLNNGYDTQIKNHLFSKEKCIKNVIIYYMKLWEIVLQHLSAVKDCTNNCSAHF